MTDVDELADALAALSRAFEAVGARWAVGGSLASAAYGEPRATNDIDVVADLDAASGRKLADALPETFHTDADAAEAAVRDGSSFNVVDERSFIKVDILVPRAGRLGRGQLDRRRTLELLPEVAVPVLGPEDVVLQKLRWYRLGGEISDRQWRDVLSVLRTTHLDAPYLEEVAAQAGLDGLLKQARTDAGG